MERYKWSFVSTLIGVVFFLLGVAFLIVAIVSVAGWESFKKDAVPVVAEITDVDIYSSRNGGKRRVHREVSIEYEYGGETYSNQLGYYTSGMKKGDEVNILVDPEKPSRSLSEPYILAGIMGVIGIVFGGIGAGFLVYELKKSRYINKLIAEDKYIYADYSHEEKANVSVNNVRYNHSVFVFDDGMGRKMTFNSAPHHPSSLPYINGDSIRVFVDMEKNPNRYYVSREK